MSAAKRQLLLAGFPRRFDHTSAAQTAHQCKSLKPDNVTASLTGLAAGKPRPGMPEPGSAWRLWHRLRPEIGSARAREILFERAVLPYVFVSSRSRWRPFPSCLSRRPQRGIHDIVPRCAARRLPSASLPRPKYACFSSACHSVPCLARRGTYAARLLTGPRSGCSPGHILWVFSASVFCQARRLYLSGNLDFSTSHDPA